MSIYKSYACFRLLKTCGIILLLLPACQRKSIKEQAKDLPHIHIQRFEQDLFDVDTAMLDPAHFDKVYRMYGDFYTGFCENTLRIPAHTMDIAGFVKYPGMQLLKKDVDSVFPDLEAEEDGLTLAMHRYREQFPSARIPMFVSYISEFVEAHNAYDSVFGIGLDMYLGANYAYYPDDFPKFMTQKMARPYLLPNTLKSLAIVSFDRQLQDKRFIAYMLFEGKVRYFAKQLLPELDDTLFLGYSAAQLKWCRENEKEVWAHFIEKKLLYDQDPNHYMRYLVDGPFTSAPDVPQESAPAIGVYTGYRIIEQFAEKTAFTLEQVMNEKDWEKILRQSEYRPE